MPDAPHVMVLGAGFGGIGTLKTLEKSPVRVTLVDRNDYHTFLPLLYQVATSELSTDEVGFPSRELLSKRPDWEFQQGTVTGVDLTNRQVSIEGMDPIPYDYLLIALGAVANFFGTKG